MLSRRSWRRGCICCRSCSRCGRSYGSGCRRCATRGADRRAESGTRDWLRIVGLAVATVAGLAIVLLPPILGDWHAMAAKAGAGTRNERDALPFVVDDVRHLESVALHRARDSVHARRLALVAARARFHGVRRQHDAGRSLRHRAQPARMDPASADVRALRAADPAVRAAVRRRRHRARGRGAAHAGARVRGRVAHRRRSRVRRTDSGLLPLSEPVHGTRAVPVRLRRRRESIRDARRARSRAARSIAISRRDRRAASR